MQFLVHAFIAQMDGNKKCPIMIYIQERKKGDIIRVAIE